MCVIENHVEMSCGQRKSLLSTSRARRRLMLAGSPSGPAVKQILAHFTADNFVGNSNQAEIDDKRAAISYVFILKSLKNGNEENVGDKYTRKHLEET